MRLSNAGDECSVMTNERMRKASLRQTPTGKRKNDRLKANMTGDGNVELEKKIDESPMGCSTGKGQDSPSSEILYSVIKITTLSLFENFFP